MTERETILRDIELLREHIGMGLKELSSPNRSPESEAEIRRQIATWFVAWSKLRSIEKPDSQGQFGTYRPSF